jgi:serine-type D-Ala-D-Ala carboxypeptidase/endopeptidase
VHAADFPSVMNRDIAPMLRRLDLAAADGGAGIVIGVSEHGVRRVMTYGAAKPDSLFEIGSITKTFTGLLLAQMAVQREAGPSRSRPRLLPPGVASAPKGFEITLLDLATHHSGLPGMPDNPPPGDLREKFTELSRRRSLRFHQAARRRKVDAREILYSNLGFTVLGRRWQSRGRQLSGTSATRDHRPAGHEGHGDLALARTAQPIDARL